MYKYYQRREKKTKPSHKNSHVCEISNESTHDDDVGGDTKFMSECVLKYFCHYYP